MSRPCLRTLVRHSAAAWFGAEGVRRRLRAGRRGTAAMEFALLFPIMVALMFGMIDATDALVIYRRVTLASEEIALIATALAVNDGASTLTPTQLYDAGTAIFGVMPGLEAQGAAQPFWVIISAVVFTGSPASCSGTTCTSYVANVAWSVPLSALTQSSGQYLGATTPTAPVRACGILTQIPKTQAPSLTQIQTSGMLNLSSAIVVDVSYQFKPLFTQVFLSSVYFTHTFIQTPRLGSANGINDYVKYDLSNPTDTHLCPPYL